MKPIMYVAGVLILTPGISSTIQPDLVFFTVAATAVTCTLAGTSFYFHTGFLIFYIYFRLAPFSFLHPRYGSFPVEPPANLSRSGNEGSNKE